VIQSQGIVNVNASPSRISRRRWVQWPRRQSGLRPHRPERPEADEEGDPVDEEGDRRAGERNNEAANDRSGQTGDLTPEAAEIIALEEDVGRDQLGDDRAHRRIEERRGRPKERALEIEVLDPELAGQAKCGDRGHHDAGPQIAQQDHPAAREPIDERAAEQHEHERHATEDRDAGPELHRRRAECEVLERECDHVDVGPEQRDRLSGPEQAEAAMPKRLEEEREAHHPTLTAAPARFRQLRDVREADGQADGGGSLSISQSRRISSEVTSSSASGPAVFDAAIFQHDDPVGPAQRRPPVRDREDRRTLSR